MLILLVALVAAFGLGKVAIAGIVVVAVLLAYEHTLVSPATFPNSTPPSSP